MTAPEHVPVMVEEVIEYLAPRSGGVYVDGTVGGGGHSQHILEHSAPDGRVIGLDRDPAQLELARRRLAEFADRITLVRASYEDVLDVLAELNLDSIDGMLIDTGPSRDQLAGRTTGRGRGFSWWGEDEPLIMAYDPSQETTARKLLAELPARELQELFDRTLRGSEVGRVTQAIVRQRERAPIETTGELTGLLREALAFKGPTVDRRVAAAYLALRIAVNDELEALRRGIDAAVEGLTGGGRLVVLTFHGLEHRIGRRRLRELEGGPIGPPRLVGAPEREQKVKVLTPKPLFPSEEEVSANPAARSARLHAAQRV
ncbi:MAG: 16S rRNA (cytosine(1402)-N(4))-methyltransferase RsmH [Armatimonadota bacterium]